MLPSLRIILAAVIAACAAVLTLSAGLVGARDPSRNITGVPDLSRTLVRQAIVEEPEWQQSQLLAYSSRRADELLRLRDLPATPVRAVVEYAEQAQARAAEAASAPTTAPPVDSATAPAAATSQEGAVVVATAPAATASADAAREPAADSAAVVTPSPAEAPRQPPTPTAAIEPVANPPSDTTAATAVAAAPAATPPSETASAAPADTTVAAAATPAPATAAQTATRAGGDAQVAAVQAGGSETAETYGPVRRATEAKPHRGGKAVHARPAKSKKKPQVARAPRNILPATTSYPADQPSSRPNDPFGNWRRSSNESTTR